LFVLPDALLEYLAHVPGVFSESKKEDPSTPNPYPEPRDDKMVTAKRGRRKCATVLVRITMARNGVVAVRAKVRNQKKRDVIAVGSS
jgi:hypothetical protein